jgi:GNAT superfamily N-acetyltransferase
MSFVCRFIEKKEMHIIMPLVLLLNPNTDLELLKARLQEMLEHTNYKCVGMFDNENLIGMCGIWVLYKLYVGKHIELDNVIVHPDFRGMNIGQQMIAFTDEYARSIDCSTSELNGYVSNNAGTKFWMNSGFNIIGFHYQKKH